MQEVDPLKDVKLYPSIPAILNLGYAYPWGFASNSQGFLGIVNQINISPQKGVLGVRQGSQFWFRGTRRGSILI